jgi:hypothetical protein
MDIILILDPLQGKNRKKKKSFTVPQKRTVAASQSLLFSQ